MLIQVNYYKIAAVGYKLTQLVTAYVKNTLEWFGGQITRVEVPADAKCSQRSGTSHGRCLPGARAVDRDPDAILVQEASLKETAGGKEQKTWTLQSRLSRPLGEIT